MPAAAAEPARIGKKELAQRLGWARSTLDRRLEQDPDFPVAQRGDRSGGWAFDEAAVIAYLAGAPDEANGVRRSDAPAPDAKPARRRTVHQGESTAAARLKAAQADLAEDRLKRQRGELVEIAPLRHVLGGAIAKLASSLSALPDTLGRRLQLPEAQVAIARQEIETARRAIYTELRDLLADPCPPTTDPAPPPMPTPARSSLRRSKA